MPLLQFLDHLIPYDTFINDLSARIVRLLKSDSDDPEFISQRKAYELFGRRNVERWKRQGKVESYKRPGKTSGCCNAPPRIISTREGNTRNECKSTEETNIIMATP